MPESQIAPLSHIHIHIFSGYRVVYNSHSSVRRVALAWPPFGDPQRTHISILSEVANITLQTMPRNTIDRERQPLLERIDEGSFKSSDHWNLAGLSQKHFWVLVGRN
jgi:hypothetical protein